eukprot:2070385-Rhodomonas_salina.1
MLPDTFSEEVSVVGLNNKTDIAKYFEAKAGFHIQRCHRELLSAKVWTFGLQSGLRSFTAQEIAAI